MHVPLNALSIAAGLAGLGALLHVAVVLGGPDWYVFFQAPPPVVHSARQGTWMAPAVTLLIAAALSLCALYALSAAGLVPPLPLCRWVLALVAALCLLRVLGSLALALFKPELLTAFELGAAAYVAATGLAFGMGLVQVWTGSTCIDAP